MVKTLQYSSLSEQVYKYLRRQMNSGVLIPGSAINISEIAEQLGISKTPLRDALIHLECEGFVTILPRRGVVVNKLSLADVKHAYDSVGLVEAFVVKECVSRITPAHIKKLEEINNRMNEEIDASDFSNLFESNLKFHNTFLEASNNDMLKKFILPLKHRLYDFPRQNFIREWELRNGLEHSQVIECLRQGDGKGAAEVLQNVHWSFEVQNEYIRQFYQISED